MLCEDVITDRTFLCDYFGSIDHKAKGNILSLFVHCNRVTWANAMLRSFIIYTYTLKTVLLNMLFEFFTKGPLLNPYCPIWFLSNPGKSEKLNAKVVVNCQVKS